MQINLIAIGTKMPAWVTAGYQEYAKRLSQDWVLNLIEIPLAKRSKTTHIEQLIEQEGEKQLAAIPNNSSIISLDQHGKSFTTEQLAQQLTDWQHHHQHLSLLIGGPDGLAKSCLANANLSWSLSSLTLPHPLVRILVAEQLYRAWSFKKGHPYHRS